MTSEPPTESVGRSRPAAEGRRAALGIPAEAAAAPPSPEAHAKHDDLLQALAHIPDLHPEQAAAAGQNPSGVWYDSGPFVEPVTNLDTPAAPDTVATDGDNPPPTPGRRARPEAPGPDGPPHWRALILFVAMALLVAAIPALGYAGYRLVGSSRDGRFKSQVTNARDPGYEAQVEPTPTAAVIQYGPTGAPVAVTFLSLTTPKGGGGVVFFPLGTEVPAPQGGINRLSDTYPVLQPDAPAVRDRTVAGVAALLDLGIEDVAEVDDARLAALAAPVAPIAIDNPEPIVLADGTRIKAGPAAITAAQVGPYLAATRPGESETAKLDRSQVLWTAWLAQIRSSTSAAPVGGEITTGLGRYLVRLAKAPVDFQTLPVTPDPNPALGQGESLAPDTNAIRALVTQVVPSPTPTGPPGFRFRVRLLEGVAPGPVPTALSRQIVNLGGTVTIVGNGPTFGQDRTTIVYADRKQQMLATYVLKAIGGTGKAYFEPSAPDSSDFTIVLGRDVMQRLQTDASSTTTATAPGPVATLGGAEPTITNRGD
jgi:hypothetical protein